MSVCRWLLQSDSDGTTLTFQPQLNEWKTLLEWELAQDTHASKWRARKNWSKKSQKELINILILCSLNRQVLHTWETWQTGMRMYKSVEQQQTNEKVKRAKCSAIAMDGVRTCEGNSGGIMWWMHGALRMRCRSTCRLQLFPFASLAPSHISSSSGKRLHFVIFCHWCFNSYPLYYSCFTRLELSYQSHLHRTVNFCLTHNYFSHYSSHHVLFLFLFASLFPSSFYVYSYRTHLSCVALHPKKKWTESEKESSHTKREII